MAIQPTFPGVYIEELDSGVRTIAGVPTSITAFVGRALRGPINTPTVINGFGDFERIFGGLSLLSSMSYAVRDYFQNGGGQAIIVRLFQAKPTTPPASTPWLDPPPVATLSLPSSVAGKNPLVLQATSPGTWANSLRARVDSLIHPDAPALLGVPAGALFNLTVRDMGTGATEVFQNVTVIDSSRRIDKVLLKESVLVQLPPGASLPEAVPAESDASFKPTSGQPTPPPFASASDPRSVGVATPVNDGDPLGNDAFTGTGLQGRKQGLFSLEQTDLFNLLCIPPPTLDGDVSDELLTSAMKYCEARRAMMIVDPPTTWTTKDRAREGFTKTSNPDIGTHSKNAALFFPRVQQRNPLRDGQLESFAPCGAIAGVIARTDAERGVFKAPAGLDATLVGIPSLTVNLTDAENGELNPLGVNCLRTLPSVGRVVWGARTLQGDDRLGSQWKYLSVRRLALFIEESLYRGTQFAVFEPNDEPLWSQLRLNVGAFMNNLFRQGAFQGQTPREAFFVKCDKDTNTQNDINLGIVNVLVGFAPLKPAEFVIIKLQQIAGQIAA